MSSGMEVIIGTYEEFLLGYKVDIKNGKTTLTQSFADKSHSGAIKCLAVQERWVVTGGTDDRIFIYDMSSRKQSQILLSHEATINSLVFTPDGTHLLSGGQDGRMIATRLKTWFTDATWKKAHNGSPVTHISCHPSGKLALSLGSDLVLRTWNLVKGRVAYKTNLKSRNTLGYQPDCLSWSTNGDYFTISGQRILEFWSIKAADVVRSHKTKSKPICLAWTTNNTCLVGLEDGKILWLSVDNQEEKEIIAHDARVKAMCVFKENLVSASSSGEIKLWQINENEQELKEIATTNIGCRPTCIGMLDLQQFGANYVISSTLGAKEKDTTSMRSKPKTLQRGIVTIEYDNDDNNDDGSGDSEEDDESGSNKGEDVENEEDSVAEEQEDEDDDNDDDGDDVKCDEDDSDNNNESGDSMDENSDASISEPEINLPKSRKHKLQIVKRREEEHKKQKLENKQTNKNKNQHQQRKFKNQSKK